MTAAHIGLFIAGLFVGTNLGVLLMCLFIVSGRRAQREEDVMGVRRS